MTAEVFINSFTKSGGKHTNLSRFRKLLDSLGNPQSSLKFVHIAGTNGKGSTLEFASAALINAGYKTGQFTSPYVNCYEDRIRINGRNIGMEDLERFAEKVRSAVREDMYSRFEITLAIALLYFKNEDCDAVFLEAGVGGLLDATNAVGNKLVCVITSVSLDHTDILGNTVEEIARQKAGIITDCPVIVSYDNPRTVTDIVKEIKQPICVHKPEIITAKRIDREVSGNKDKDIPETCRFTYRNVEYSIQMHGIHQVYNACTAIEIVRCLRDKGYIIPNSALESALLKVKLGLRMEIISKHPYVILDGCHNISGALALAQTLKNSEFETVGIVGMLKQKDCLNIAEILCNVFDIIICVDGFDENNIPAWELSEIFAGCGKDSLIMDLNSACKFLEDPGSTHTLTAVCGSMYLTSQLKKCLKSV
ncbi:MAG: bifunctional tetrahydrofolate synthase/dihydrofolate synthase [Oscillospiraceae bacterium]|jgi:dihydrofolate synthase/folylpolyglutamate synthase|nr:bifunctional tetrahydrofolate synthase/dihydrofolate synthase [Oscillospiraceae bacterium]